MSTTSLKLPDDLKKRTAAAAKARGITTHAFMLDAVQQATTAAEKRQEFIESALAARRDMETTGRYYEWAEVRDYFRAKVRGQKAPRPRLRQRK